MAKNWPTEVIELLNFFFIFSSGFGGRISIASSSPSPFRCVQFENPALRIKQVTEQNLTPEKMLTELSKEFFNGNQVSDILNNPIEFPTELIEKLSLATALKYWNRQMGYRDGDCIMNNIFTFWISNEYYFKNYGFPDIAWECYNAFDSGEFYREKDDKNIDPSEKYTRPLVESLLTKRKQIV